MDKKSKPLIFVGYCEDINAYRLVDPATHDVFFHTHIQFDEHLHPHHSLSSLSPCSSSSLLVSPMVDMIEDDTSVALVVEHLDPTVEVHVAFVKVPAALVEDPAPATTMPRWAHTVVEEAAPFIWDLPPSRRTPSTSIGLVVNQF